MQLGDACSNDLLISTTGAHHSRRVLHPPDLGLLSLLEEQTGIRSLDSKLQVLVVALRVDLCCSIETGCEESGKEGGLACCCCCYVLLRGGGGGRAGGGCWEELVACECEAEDCEGVDPG